MKIKEVEECLQVPRATIRFYEKEGLINPKKGENGYREYSDYDILILKKIIVLRKLGFSVADIEGNRLVSIPKAIFLVIISVLIFGLMQCYFDGVWNIRTFAEGLKMLLAIIILEIIVGIPIYFAGKKNPDVIKNRGKIKLIIYTGMLLLFVVLIMLLVSI